ncbi:serine/threonine-protein phosphatase 2A activator [Drosophila takahashii]|uniref:serine/threonine-protein phosphatase 2A activator n=1 Tax=Drosophila takahashii TaxID=29030 RepID=UPI001CF8978C|nr:serine/threonine-protein phosphatase 2A activator [Drosophila takahashii]
MMSDRLGYDVTDPTVQVLRSSAFMQNGPVKQVRSLEDLDRWVRSQAYHDTIAYINHTSRAIQGHRMSRNRESRNFDFPVSEQMRRLCEIFDGLDHLLIEHTPKPEDSDPVSYKTWMQQMFQHVFSKLDEAIRSNCKHINELGQYLRRSFGNVTTMDFGPANELMFVFFLCGLFRAGILLAGDTIAAALMLYNRYIHLVRRLVATYSLPLVKDPMSSIDDYCLLPYLWGAAQLSLDSPFSPMQCEQQQVQRQQQDYMMLELVEHLQRSRSGQLSQVAFQLWSLLSVPTWPQVYRGLERNYIDTVLCSFQTLEQAIFCELMSFEPAMPPGNQLERAYLGAQYLERHNQEEEENAEEQANLWEPSPPVSRYVSMEPESFLGFQEPSAFQPKTKSKSKANEKEDSEEDQRFWMLRQVVDEKDPNNAMFFPDRAVNQNDSVTSFATEGP